MVEKTLPEWPHKIDADDIGSTPLRTSISASPQERKDLARRLQVVSVDSLEAKLTLERNPGNLVLHVTGALKAKVTQSCVVSLDLVEEEIEAPVEGWFANPDSAVSITRARHERQGRTVDAELVILEEKDDPEPVIDGQIDLGELVTQHLSLVLNPFPHKEGVVFEGANEQDEGKIPKVRQNPFAALKNWKKKEGRES